MSVAWLIRLPRVDQLGPISRSYTHKPDSAILRVHSQHKRQHAPDQFIPPLMT